jgi:23S rRNA pseudouridine2605 synthase
MAQEQDAGERLSRFLAHAGIASRRRAEALITAGRVQVNGVRVTEQGMRINPDIDLILVDNKPVHATSRRVYLLLNKPIGYVSTAHDPQLRPTVLDLLPSEIRALRVYPVGRLDIDTSGLLLLTNDGDFALHLTHPRYSMLKHYQALVKGWLSESSLQTLHNGVTIVEDQGRSHTTAPAEIRVLRKEGPDCWLSLTIHEGRKRQVRRMLATVGHPVLELSRVGIGPIILGDLPVGKWRFLTADEVHSLESYSRTS